MHGPARAGDADAIEAIDAKNAATPADARVMDWGTSPSRPRDGPRRDAARDTHRVRAHTPRDSRHAPAPPRASPRRLRATQARARGESRRETLPLHRQDPRARRDECARARMLP